MGLTKPLVFNFPLSIDRWFPQGPQLHFVTLRPKVRGPYFYQGARAARGFGRAEDQISSMVDDLADMFDPAGLATGVSLDQIMAATPPAASSPAASASSPPKATPNQRGNMFGLFRRASAQPASQPAAATSGFFGFLPMFGGQVQPQQQTGGRRAAPPAKTPRTAAGLLAAPARGKRPNTNDFRVCFVRIAGLLSATAAQGDGGVRDARFSSRWVVVSVRCPLACF